MPSTSAIPQRTNRLAKVCLALRRALKLDDWVQYRGYRPEKHYMRGPGPKSRSRHTDRDQRSTSR
jgi:hypothetical protein